MYNYRNTHHEFDLVIVQTFKRSCVEEKQFILVENENAHDDDNNNRYYVSEFNQCVIVQDATRR